MWLLDSNVISELRRADRCHPAVKEWETRVELTACWISVVTILEIRRGICQVEGKDAQFASALDRWLETRVKPTFERRILPISTAIAEKAGRLASLRTRSLADCLIASTALSHKLTLVTRNLADFEDIKGLSLVNPWGGEESAP